MSSIQKTISTIIKDSFTTTAIDSSGGFIQFAAATKGLTGEQAATVPAEGLNSVWTVVLHLTVVQTAFEAALRGEESSGVVAWPPIGEISDENWKNARQKSLEINTRMVQTIANITNEQLEERLPYWFNVITREAILTIYGHISYHTAEIVTIRHIQGLRVDHPFA